MLLDPALNSPLLRGAELPPAMPDLLPLVGSTLTLSVLAVEQQGVRVATPEGLTLLLPGLAEAGLQAGSQLLMKVVATEPRLQLARVQDGTATVPQQADGRPTAGEPVLLPPRWSLVKPGAEPLAAGWRGVLQAAILPAVTGMAASQPWLLAGQRLEPDPLLLARRLAEQGWHLAHGWPGQVLHLGVEDPLYAANPAEPVLLLRLQLPPWGEIWLRVAGSSAGPLLQLGSNRPAVLAQWQPRLADWRQALLTAGLAVVELQLCLAAVSQLKQHRLQPGAYLPLATQFRLAARVLLLLQAEAEQEMAAGSSPSLQQGVEHDD